MHAHIRFLCLIPTFELQKKSSLLHMLQTDALKILEGISINRAPIMKAKKKKKEKHKRNGKHNNKQVTYQQGNNLQS